MSTIETKPNKTYTVYWLDGSKSVIKGENITHAFNKAGYGNGAIRAVDFYDNGNDDNYIWNKEQRTWVKKSSLN